MNNIKDNSTLRKVAEYLNYVLLVFPILVDFVGFVSLFIPNIQNSIMSHVSMTAFWCILVGVNVVLIASIIAATELRHKEKITVGLKFVGGYKALLKEHTINLMRFEEKCDEFQTVDELYGTVFGYLKSMVDEVSRILSDITGEKIRVCIKSFPEKYDHRDVHQMELITFYRSNAGWSTSELERKERIKVVENTDFKHILVESYPYFAFNGLDNFEKVTKMKYQNSTKDWRKKYNATIVNPISKFVSVQKSQEKYEILGFLCADTLKTDAFSADYGMACQDFLASIAFLLCIFLDKCILHREKIEEKQFGAKV